MPHRYNKKTSAGRGYIRPYNPENKAVPGEHSEIPIQEKDGAKGKPIKSEIGEQKEAANPSEVKSTDKSFIKALAFFSQAGITIAACVFIGVFLGRFIDKKLNTSPWLLLTFSLLGVLAALKAIFDLSGKK